jgi:hypothetical protein
MRAHYRVAALAAPPDQVRGRQRGGPGSAGGDGSRECRGELALAEARLAGDERELAQRDAAGPQPLDRAHLDVGGALDDESATLCGLERRALALASGPLRRTRRLRRQPELCARMVPAADRVLAGEAQGKKAVRPAGIEPDRQRPVAGAAARPRHQGATLVEVAAACVCKRVKIE